MGAVILRLIVSAPLAAFEEPTLGHKTTVGRWRMEEKTNGRGDLRGSPQGGGTDRQVERDGVDSEDKMKTK